MCRSSQPRRARTTHPPQPVNERAHTRCACARALSGEGGGGGRGRCLERQASLLASLGRQAPLRIQQGSRRRRRAAERDGARARCRRVQGAGRWARDERSRGGS